MHVLAYARQQLLEWAQCIWSSLAVGSGAAPALPLWDVLCVYKEALLGNAQAALQLFTQQLASHKAATGIQFASVALLSSEGEKESSFGVAALHGRGAQHFPAVLQSNETAWLNGKRGAQQRRFTLSPKQVFLTAESNWAVTDVHSINMETPCLYECHSSTRGLPHEAQWLSREGMRSMLTLPCIHEDCVWGVLTVASPQSHFGYRQVSSLQQLCYQITPLVVKARNVLDSVLCNGQFSRCQSTNELATCMLDEIVQLDKILVKRINQCAAESALEEEEKAAAVKDPPSTPESCSISQIVLPTPPLSAPPLASHTPKGLPPGNLPSLDADGPLQSCSASSRADKEDKEGGSSTSRGARLCSHAQAADLREGGTHGTLACSQAQSSNEGMVHADISALLGKAMDAGTLSALTSTTTTSSADTPRNSGQYSRPGTSFSLHPSKRRGCGSGNCSFSRTSMAGSNSNSPRTTCTARAPQDCSLAPLAAQQYSARPQQHHSSLQQCSSLPQPHQGVQHHPGYQAPPAAQQCYSDPQHQGIHPSRQLPEKPNSAPALPLRGGRRCTGRHSHPGLPDVSSVCNNAENCMVNNMGNSVCNCMGYNVDTNMGHNNGHNMDKSCIGYNSMGRRGTVQPGAMIQTQEAGWGEVQDESGAQNERCPSRLGCRVSTSQQGGFSMGSVCGGSEVGYESGSGEEGGGNLEVWEHVGSGHCKEHGGEAEGENQELHGQFAKSQQQQQQQRGQRDSGSMPYNGQGELDEVDVGLVEGSEGEEEQREGGRSRGFSGCGNGLHSLESSASATLSERSPSSGGDDPKLWGLDVFVKDSSMLDDFSRRLQGSAAYVAAVAQAQEDQSAMVMAASDRASTNRSVSGRISIGGAGPSPPSRGPSVSGSGGGSRPSSGSHVLDSGSWEQAHVGKACGRPSPQPPLAPASGVHDMPPSSHGWEGRQSGSGRGDAEGLARKGGSGDGRPLERGSRGMTFGWQADVDGHWDIPGQEGLRDAFGSGGLPDEGWWDEESMADGEQELRRPHVWCSSAGALEYEAGYEDDEDVVAARAAQEPAQFLVSNLLHAAEAERMTQQQQQQQQQQQRQQQVRQQQGQGLKLNDGQGALAEQVMCQQGFATEKAGWQQGGVAKQVMRQQVLQRQEYQRRKVRASYEEYHNRRLQQHQARPYPAVQASPFQTEVAPKPYSNTNQGKHSPHFNRYQPLQPQLQAAVQPSVTQLLQQQQQAQQQQQQQQQWQQQQQKEEQLQQQQQKEEQLQQQQQQLSELNTWHQQLPMLLPTSSHIDNPIGCCTRSPLDPATLLPHRDPSPPFMVTNQGLPSYSPHPLGHARYPHDCPSPPSNHQFSLSIPSHQSSMPPHQSLSKPSSNQAGSRPPAETDRKPAHHSASSLDSRRLYSMPITIYQPPEDTSDSYARSADLSCNLSAHCGSLDSLETAALPATAPASTSTLAKAGHSASGSNGFISPSPRHTPVSSLEGLARKPALPSASARASSEGLAGKPAAAYVSAGASLDAASGSQQQPRQYKLGGGSLLDEAACAGDPPTEGMLRHKLGIQPLVTGPAHVLEVQSPRHQYQHLYSPEAKRRVLSPPHSRRLFSLPEEQEGLVAS